MSSVTTHEIGQRAPSRHARRKRRRNYGPVIILALVCAAIFAAGYCVGVSAADKAVPTLPEPVLESSATPEPSAEPSVAPTPSPTPEAVLWRDDIVTDGNLLDYDLQVTMQAVSYTHLRRCGRRNCGWKPAYSPGGAGRTGWACGGHPTRSPGVLPPACAACAC